MRGGHSAAAVRIPIALLAEDEAVGGASEGGGLGGAVIADLGAEMLLGEGVGGVHVLVTREAELGAVGAAVEYGRPVAAKIAAHHYKILGNKNKNRNDGVKK